MAFTGLTLKPLEIIQTTDDTPTTLFLFDITLNTILTEFGYSASSNYQKFNLTILAGAIDDYGDGYVDSACVRFEFTTYYNITSGLSDFLDSTPLATEYQTNLGDGGSLVIDFVITGNYLVCTVVGTSDKSFQWMLYGDQIITFPDLES